MKRIHRLSPETAERIAAGEVVDRPASALKELLENALDAGATSITMRVDQGGKNLLEVSDNGCGMDADDALLALERFTTSKISTVSDLETITSFGFRGEALPSIATVSHLELCSRTDEGEGVRILCDGGRIMPPEPWEGGKGTIVRARELFYNLPARRKFLQSDSRELALCMEVFNGAALAAPEVSFRFWTGTRWASTLAPAPLEQRIGELMGHDLTGSLLSINAEVDKTIISGYITPPTITRPHAGAIRFLINKRPVTARPLMRALLRGYGIHLLPRRYPVAVIVIEMPPDQIDPNVHPRKEEVRLVGEERIGAALEYAVRSVLDTFQPALGSSAIVQPYGDTSHQFTGYSNRSGYVSHPSQKLLIPDDFSPLFNYDEQAREAGLSFMPPPTVVHSEDQVSGRMMIGSFGRILGQYDHTYILTECDGVLSLIDQHAAHERILYEELCQLKGDNLPAQTLLIPITVSLSPVDSETILSHLNELKEMGFELEPFGDGQFLLRSVSAVVRSGFEQDSLEELLDDFANPSVTDISPRERQLRRLACIGAIKAGETLNLTEMESLLRNLSSSTYPNICPHGRPIVIELRREEVERRFRRHN